jgi:hypothetical protein
MKITYLKIAKLILLLFICVSVHSQEQKENKYEFSISGGCLLSGKVQGSYESDFNPDNTITIKNSASPMGRIVFDYYLKPKFSVGANINFEKFNIADVLYKGESLDLGNEMNLGTWDGREHVINLNDIKVLELNVSAKWRWALNERIFLKPCIYIGYRRSFSSSLDAREDGMVLNYNIECQYYIIGKHFITADLGIFSQPVGGVKDVAWVRSFGVPYVSVGYGFSID